MSIFEQPMLASPCKDAARLKLPVIGSPKYDGIRCISEAARVISRTLKPIPNYRVQEALAGLPPGLDGELICGSVTAPDVFTRTQSLVMSADVVPVGLGFHVFDRFMPGTFEERQAHLDELFASGALGDRPVVRVPHVRITSTDELAAYEEKCVAEGYEGVMVRSLTGAYKQGRATEKEGSLLKIKRFTDDEGVVVGVQELLRNGNEATLDERGYTKRSSHAENKVGGGTMGALILKWRDVEFGLGTGYDADQRAQIWADREKVVGRRVTFKFQGVGVDGRPRFPVFRHFREAE